MTKSTKKLATVAAAVALAAIGCPAFANGSIKDAAAPEGRTFSWSFNIGATTDYVFRGYSQSAEDPVIQGGIDVGYGILYAGIWGSGLDFGTNLNGTDVADIEVDYYVGIKPVWGPVTFDLGVIYYTYPGANDGGAAVGEVPEADYVEIKLGASGQLIPKLTTGLTVFYSPEYTNEQGEVWTVEGALAYELPKIGVFTPTLGGVIGGVFGDATDGFFSGNGDDEYMYWNVGVALAVDKLTLDFRYWDTNIDNNGAVAGYCTGAAFQCDERFVFTAKVTLP
jgi:uncharacterized protein (TIGR02001 family)